MSKTSIIERILTVGTFVAIICALGLLVHSVIVRWSLPLPYTIIILFISITVTSNLLSRIVYLCIKG